MNTYGNQFMISLLKDKEGLKKLITTDVKPDLFYAGQEQDFYNFVMTHVLNYGKLPNDKTVSKELDLEILNVVEPPEFYLDKMKERHTFDGLKKLFIEGSSLLNSDKAYEALQTVNNYSLEATIRQNEKSLYNVPMDAHKLITQDYNDHLKAGDQYGVKLGWPKLDNFVGGLTKGDYMSIVGRVNTGKTFLMLYIAHYVWKVLKKVPMIITMEMKPLPIMQRIIAMEEKISITQLKKAVLSTKNWKRVQHDLSVLQGDKTSFWVVDGNLAVSGKEIAAYAQQFKPDIILVDGAYMLQSINGKYKPRWEIIAENIEYMKRKIATEIGIPVISSYQFNKEAAKILKKGEKPGLEHIGGSEVISQISSLVLGLMEEETIATRVIKQIEILKGRNGEEGSFSINWIFDQWPFMDFSQVKQQDKTMKFL